MAVIPFGIPWGPLALDFGHVDVIVFEALVKL
jgi:hypothetical protein